MERTYSALQPSFKRIEADESLKIKTKRKLVLHSWLGTCFGADYAVLTVRRRGDMKIVLAGPPRSGKSCLREGLKQAIKAIQGAPYPYVITACPDGEGSWFQETVNQDPSLAAACKAAYKAKFTPEFVQRIATSVRNCDLSLTLVDIGGIPSVENEAICASATHVIILAGDLDRLPEWHAFSQKVGLSVIAEVWSDYAGTQDTVPSLGSDGVYRGSVHHLERGEPVSERLTIRALAEILVRMASEQE